MIDTTLHSTPQVDVALTDRLLPALAAAVLGFVILYGAGFASSDVIHGAAHDLRHAAAFPCH